MAAPKLITLQLGQVMSLEQFTLPDIDKFLEALPEELTELVFIASRDYDITNGYEILTPDDQSFGLFGRVLFGSTTSENTANFNSIKESGNSFPQEFIKDTTDFYFNVTANTAIDSIYFDIVDAETKSISYTKITGNYTPLYFKVTNTKWIYAKDHNKSVIPFGIGSKNNIPNNATTTWVPGLSEDNIAAELYNGLEPSQIEVKVSASQVNTTVDQMSNENWTKGLAKINITNDLTNPIIAKKFNMTIRDIEDKTIYSNITFNYEEQEFPVITHKAIEEFTTNSIYGSGTTTVKEGEVLQFGSPRGTISSTKIADWIGYLQNSDDINKNPAYLINNTGGKSGTTTNFMTFSMGSKSDSGVLFSRSIMKYKPIVTVNQGDEQGFIMSQPIVMPTNHGQTPQIRVGKNIVNKISKAVMTTDSTGATSNRNGSANLLPTNQITTIVLTKKYPDFKMVTGTYQDPIPQGVDVLSAVWDNQQQDLIDIDPFINDQNQFCCRIIPKTTENRTALVYVQLHNSAAWDNGKYIHDVFRFNITKGNNNQAPMEVDSQDITIMTSQIYTFKTFNLKETVISATVDNSRVARLDVAKKTITGIRPGTTKVTVTGKTPGYDNVTREINVTVLDYPQEPAIRLNRKVIVIDVGSSTQIKVSSDRVDSIEYRHSPDQYVEIQDFLTYDGQGHTNGVINIKGKEEGIELLNVVGKFKGVEQTIEEIEIHVIERGTYKIVTNQSKIKADLKKDRNGKAFWATTNAGFLRWELRDGEELFSVTGNPGTEYTDINILINPLVKGNTTLTLYGHDDDMTKRVVELHVPVKITKNVEIAKNEIWVSGEHKFAGVNDEEIDFLDRRYFTIMKWLDRPTKDDVYGHTIFLPQRSGTLLTYEQLQDSKGIQKRYFDLAGKGHPTRSTNPKSVGYIYLDTLTGEIWKCLDNTKDSNHWFSDTGKQIGKQEQMIYPKPGEKGFGVGPMSYDLHEEYGLTPMEGCFDPWSDHYGNYKDQYGNVYVYIPKHYIKSSGAPISSYTDRYIESTTLDDNDDETV